MERIQKVIVQEIIKIFISSFSSQFSKENKKLQMYKINTNKILPKILLREYGVEAIFSIDKGHFMLNFTDNNIGTITTRYIYGDVIDVFDETGQWSKNEGAIGIGIQDSGNINLKSVGFKGIKPFTLSGNNIEMYIEDMEFYSPTGLKRNIKYAFVFSFAKLVDTYSSIEDFTSNFVFAYWSYYDEYKEKLDSTSDKYTEYMLNLRRIKNEMDYYFYDKNVLERDIEDFINKNFVIISEILGLDNPIVQANLEDINQIYGQKLKPDLMGFDSIRNNWTIVDYKTGRRSNLIKSPGGVRVKFYDDVAKLEAQLRIYRKYFNEKDHREYFNKKYSTTINEYPHTIGIIGYVDKESRKDFNELLNEKARWFELIPYNDLQVKFEKFISMVEKIS